MKGFCVKEKASCLPHIKGNIVNDWSDQKLSDIENIWLFFHIYPKKNWKSCVYDSTATDSSFRKPEIEATPTLLRGAISTYVSDSRSSSTQSISKNQIQLDAHVIKQAGYTLHTCNHCSYATYHKGHFNIHMRVHTGERPFKCYMCEKAFTQKIGLRRHLLCHQNTNI
ncbi:hypothetical protein NPIL_199931 [Nephila pilipes]|uniref:C2H2-type domain-containing protein n=1 Tax=Nephila pilipes TaxID=299642 RepID=A0A8X6MWV4_NEPPI|nr:hypothetical protein NPIL_199931 [Nephila pilipes]